MHGYWTENPAEAWLIDSTMDSVNDEMSKIGAMAFATPEQKKDLIYEYLTKGLTTWLSIIEKRLNGKRFLIGQRITCGDFMLGGFLLSTVANKHYPYYWTCQHILKSFPSVIEYIENFKKEVQDRLDTRSPASM